MAAKEALDLDLDFDEPSEAEIKKLPFTLVRLSAKTPEWRVLTGLNSYNLSALTSGDAEAIAAFIDNVIHPDDRQEFRRFLNRMVNLTPAKLGSLINKLIEVASERPTTLPSVSRVGASKRVSTRKSAASS